MKEGVQVRGGKWKVEETVNPDFIEKILNEFKIRVQAPINSLEILDKQFYKAAEYLAPKAIKDLKSFESYLEDMIYEEEGEDESIESDSKAPSDSKQPTG